jgi:hypothetical protein
MVSARALIVVSDMADTASKSESELALLRDNFRALLF